MDNSVNGISPRPAQNGFIKDCQDTSSEAGLQEMRLTPEAELRTHYEFLYGMMTAAKLASKLSQLNITFLDVNLNNIEYADAAFNIDFNIYESMPETTKSIFKDKYEAIIRDLKALNIDFPRRFRSPRSVQEIIHNRENLNETDPRPLAVLIYAKQDESNAFAINNQIESLVNMGHYRVVYFEAGTDEEVFDCLKKATAIKPAELLVLAGHGERSLISFGADDPRRSPVENEDKYIDTSDGDKMRKNNLPECLADYSFIVLESCSTGEGKEKANNVANFMRSIFKRSEIFAPTMTAFVRKYKYDESGRVIDVVYDIGKENTYSIEKK